MVWFMLYLCMIWMYIGEIIIGQFESGGDTVHIAESITATVQEGEGVIFGGI